MKQKKPNILFIMTDQLRGDCLGIAGHPDVKTPYLDTLAAKGVLFSNAYSACPSCIPARAALHTGMLPEHHRRVGYQDGIAWRYEHTLAGELSRAGYYTQCVGKMHVHPLRNYLGFHNVELHDGYLHYARYGSVPYRESQHVADDYYYWLKEQKGISADPMESGLDCNSWVARPFPYEEKYHPTNWVTDRSIDFLRRRDPDQPFFLMASYLRPHPPFDAPAYYFDLYKDKKLTPPYVGDWEDTKLLKERGRIFDSLTGPEDEELIRQAQIGYYACITHLDHQIGRLLMALTEHELQNDTMIFFTADHGEELCDHHHFRKSLPYQGSIHIPLIISGNPELTGFAPHSVCDEVTELCDIMPTLLDIAGADIPDRVDGKSLLAFADGEGREYLHGEHSYGELSNHYIVTKKDKFCWFSTSGTEHYFVLEEDPHELHDRIEDPACRERIAYLRNCLIRELTGRPEGFTDGTSLIAGREYPVYLAEK
ncbi:arylsulfatase [Marvinbryantia formatexigens DSM 14469]|uniref:Arylsulfatase n=1 Tax=Marvinbryantia formatexigens DSM 14469 TaxID=478749 RepID=C6LAI4_9FIRM|nr:arylsulfatase [Marvinbryantia formatexigens]EET62591.1 arylsulfatase [Marvinbryantia formatexigens DSM 14469]UWO23253.1 arylsulfatase [Marvinbryantia formatexigens DSM 14469]SDG61141.1 Arylsulfatase A [Marvinbryantia formatexigens]